MKRDKYKDNEQCWRDEWIIKLRRITYNFQAETDTWKDREKIKIGIWKSYSSKLIQVKRVRYRRKKKANK